MIALRDDAVKTVLGSVETYSFGLLAALGMALCIGTLAVLMRRAKWKKGAASLTSLLAGLLGFAVARLFFGLMDDSLGQPLPLWAMVRADTGGYSMMGALIGACMGGILAAWIAGQSPRRTLDFLAPALLLFVACERLGEGFIEEFGVSRTLSDSLFEQTFLAVEGEYGWHLRIYLIEFAVALALCAVLLWDLKAKRREGDTFILFLLLFGASQILMESLRYDRQMCVNTFVKVQQVIAMMLLASGVIAVAARSWRKCRGWAIAALVSLLAAVGIGVGIEFMIDRTAVSHYFLYLCFVLTVSVPVWMGIRLRKEGDRG